MAVVHCCNRSSQAGVSGAGVNPSLDNQVLWGKHVKSTRAPFLICASVFPAADEAHVFVRWSLEDETGTIISSPVIFCCSRQKYMSSTLKTHSRSSAYQVRAGHESQPHAIPPPPSPGNMSIFRDFLAQTRTTARGAQVEIGGGGQSW